MEIKKKQKSMYLTPSMESYELETSCAIFLEGSGGTGGTGEDIPWGAPGMQPFNSNFKKNHF